MPATAIAVSVSIETEDHDALERAVIRYAASIAEQAAEAFADGHIPGEFKFQLHISGRPVAAYLDTLGRDDSNSLVANARATVFSSPIEATRYHVDLTKSQGGWSARLTAAVPISSD